MSCESVRSSITAYLDQLLTGAEEARLMQHLSHCRDCATQIDAYRHSRAMLRGLPVASPPPELRSRLRVLASHERERRLARIDWSTRLDHLGARIRLWTDNLMRPVALPFAGGLVSAMFLFGMLVPALLFQIDLRNDVPTQLSYIEATAEPTEPLFPEANLINHNDDETTVVELTIDERGQVTDWSTSGKLDQAHNSLLGQLVFFSRYSPASLFGQPVSGKVIVRRDRIVVRG